MLIIHMRIQDQLIYDIVDLITNLLKKNQHIYPATQREQMIPFSVVFA